MTRVLTAAVAMAALFAFPAAAQTGTQTGVGNPAGTPPGTPQAAPGVPAPHQPNQADRSFVRAATIGGMAEVELGKLAEQKGHSDAVKSFGQRMVQDHTKANNRLAALAKAADIPQPDALDDEHRAMRDQLTNFSGERFDQAYMRGQMTDHQKTAQLLEYEIGSGQDTALKSFASETLPIILDHLHMAQDILARMTGAAQQASGAPAPYNR